MARNSCEIKSETWRSDSTWRIKIRREKYLDEFWRLWDRASWWYICIVKPTRCTIFKFIEYHSTCFGRSFCPSSGVEDCTHNIRCMPYSLVDCLLAGTRWNSEFHLVPASKQSTNLYDIYLMLYVQSFTPDYGQKDRPKHVEWYSINSKIVHLVGFTIEIETNVTGISYSYVDVTWHAWVGTGTKGVLMGTREWTFGSRNKARFVY